jgi:hypothetical protein
MSRLKPLYYRRRFPAEIISHCVWLYFRFYLSYRDVEEIMAERGVVVTYETIRDWSQKFGGTYAKRLRSRAARPGDRWHLDEGYLSINGKLQYLWRAVDQDGDVLDNPGATAPQPAGCEEVLSQAAARTAVHSSRRHHRQTEQLRRREDGGIA